MNRNLIILAAVLLFIVVTTRPIPYEEPYFFDWDIHYYRQMGEAAPGLADDVYTPWAYRIAAPWLAGVMPFSLDASFYILTIVLAIAMVALFYLLLRQYVSSTAAILVGGAGLILAKYLVAFNIFAYFFTKDMIGLCAAILVLLLIKKRQPVWAGLVMVMTVPFSEGILALAPALLWTSRDRKTVGAVIGAVAVFVVIRVSVDAPGVTLFEQFFDSWTRVFSPYTMVRRVVTPFLPLLVVPVFYWRSTLSLLKREPHLVLVVIGVFAGSLFGINYERLMLLAAPVVFLTVAYAVEQNRLSTVTLWGLGVAVLVDSQHWLYTVFPFPSERNHTPIVMAVATVIAATSLVYPRLMARRRTVEVS